MNQQLKKGTLELCVLSLLTRRDMYGFELAASISAHIEIAEGTIYPLLKRIKDEGYVDSYLRESNEGAPRKYYSLTESGRIHQEALAKEWNKLNEGLKKIMEEKNG